MANSKLFIVFIALLCMLCSINNCNATQPKFPAILVFGDSTVDPGNNNYLNTLFKANVPPYGVDFPHHTPTGRFSDGKLVPDFAASYFGIKDAVPPYLDPNLSDNELLTGVSFASAGSGLDHLTTTLSNVIPVSRQVDMFKDYIEKLKDVVGEEKTNKIVAEALVIISAGTNDFVFNFFDFPTRRLQYDGSGYERYLLDRLQDFIKQIYDLGCRRMIVAGVPPIGCLPIQMTTRLENPLNRQCLEDQNSEAQSYNKRLAKLLPQIQAKLSGSNFGYANIYQPLMDMINNPDQYGFVETNRGCCGTGLLEASFLCNPSTICKDPSEYIFWDSIHPTQEVYRRIAEYLEKEVIPKLV